MSTHDHGTHGDQHGHHVPGQMDITEQVRTFGGFITGGIYLAVAVVAILVFMALVNS